MVATTAVTVLAATLAVTVPAAAGTGAPQYVDVRYIPPTAEAVLTTAELPAAALALLDDKTAAPTQSQSDLTAAGTLGHVGIGPKKGWWTRAERFANWDDHRVGTVLTGTTGIVNRSQATTVLVASDNRSAVQQWLQDMNGYFVADTWRSSKNGTWVYGGSDYYQNGDGSANPGQYRSLIVYPDVTEPGVWIATGFSLTDPVKSRSGRLVEDLGLVSATCTAPREQAIACADALLTAQVHKYSRMPLVVLPGWDTPSYDQPPVVYRPPTVPAAERIAITSFARVGQTLKLVIDPKRLPKGTVIPVFRYVDGVTGRPVLLAKVPKFGTKFVVVLPYKPGTYVISQMISKTTAVASKPVVVR